MLHAIKSLKGYTLTSLDGEIGRVREFYFDDRHWTIRYLVADTAHWLPGRQVLISPYALSGGINAAGHIAVQLTQRQIEDSPPLDSDKPVSRQFEENYYNHFGWPLYWDGPYVWGSSPQLLHDRDLWRSANTGGATSDHHLRSTQAVTGCHIQAADGEIGHVEDFVVDDRTWTIRYLVVGTRNWLPGKRVLVAPAWIDRISWDESKVFVGLSRETIRKSPEYLAETLITRDYENSLHGHYNRQGYWVDEQAPLPQSA